MLRDVAEEQLAVDRPVEHVGCHHAAEFGVVAAKNISQLPALLEVLAAEEAVSDAAKEMLAFLGGQLASSTSAPGTWNAG